MPMCLVIIYPVPSTLLRVIYYFLEVITQLLKRYAKIVCSCSLIFCWYCITDGTGLNYDSILIKWFGTLQLKLFCHQNEKKLKVEKIVFLSRSKDHFLWNIFLALAHLHSFWNWKSPIKKNEKNVKINSAQLLWIPFILRIVKTGIYLLSE